MIRHVTNSLCCKCPENSLRARASRAHAGETPALQGADPACCFHASPGCATGAWGADTGNKRLLLVQLRKRKEHYAAGTHESLEEDLVNTALIEPGKPFSRLEACTSRTCSQRRSTTRLQSGVGAFKNTWIQQHSLAVKILFSWGAEKSWTPTLRFIWVGVHTLLGTRPACRSTFAANIRFHSAIFP